MIRSSSIAVALLGLAANAFAQTVTVTDGDTIHVNGTIYRLWGIDAPESKQTCPDGWAAGKAATEAMRGYLLGHQVVCEDRGHDRYRRTIGLCKADGYDLGQTMVSAGMAWAFVRYSRDYVRDEEAAKAANLGVHAHHCQPAWEWRADHK